MGELSQDTEKVKRVNDIKVGNITSDSASERYYLQLARKEIIMAGGEWPGPEADIRIVRAMKNDYLFSDAKITTALRMRSPETTHLEATATEHYIGQTIHKARKMVDAEAERGGHEREHKMAAALREREKEKPQEKQDQRDLDPARKYQLAVKNRIASSFGNTEVAEMDIEVVAEMLKQGYRRHEVTKALREGKGFAGRNRRDIGEQYIKNVLDRAMKLPDVQRCLKQHSKGLER